MDSAFVITAFATMFVVIDPIALAPLFLALTQGMDRAARLVVARNACLVAICVLAGFAAGGEALLAFLGISMPAFRIAGGVLLFLTALDMLFSRRTKRREDQAEDEPHDDPSVFPLAIPLIAGPGAIATMILLAGQMPGWAGVAWAIAIMMVVVASSGVLFLGAHLMEQVLGRTGINVVTRLLGMLLAALAVQFVVDGLHALGFAG